jgi:hypothetical protein
MGWVAVALAIWLAGLAVHDALRAGSGSLRLSRSAMGYRSVLLLLFYAALIYTVVDAL